MCDEQALVRILALIGGVCVFLLGWSFALGDGQCQENIRCPDMRNLIKRLRREAGLGD